MLDDAGLVLAKEEGKMMLDAFGCNERKALLSRLAPQAEVLGTDPEALRLRVHIFSKMWCLVGRYLLGNGWFVGNSKSFFCNAQSP